MLKDNEEKHWERIKNQDYYATDFYEKHSQPDIKTNLIFGEHKEKPPFVTIVITTYKRVDTLKYAIRSALEQKGFDDYEVIVSDNSGEDSEWNGQIEELIRSFHSDKLIYYRHEKSLNSRTSRAISLVRSKWFCLLHDDDVLVENHLRVLSHIICNNSHISYLACGLKIYRCAEVNETDFRKLRKRFEGEYLVTRRNERNYQYGFESSWLGAMIDKDKFFAAGAMDLEESTGINDYCMVARFAHYFGVYYCSAPLYKYRIWKNQISSQSADVWLNCYTTEYFLYRFISSRQNILLRPLYREAAKYKILYKIREMKKSLYRFNVDEKKLKKNCELENIEYGSLNCKICIFLIDHIVMKMNDFLLRPYQIKGVTKKIGKSGT